MNFTAVAAKMKSTEDKCTRASISCKVGHPSPSWYICLVVRELCHFEATMNMMFWSTCDQEPQWHELHDVLSQTRQDN